MNRGLVHLTALLLLGLRHHLLGAGHVMGTSHSAPSSFELLWVMMSHLWHNQLKLQSIHPPSLSPCLPPTPRTTNTHNTLRSAAAKLGLRNNIGNDRVLVLSVPSHLPIPGLNGLDQNHLPAVAVLGRLHLRHWKKQVRGAREEVWLLSPFKPSYHL